MKPSPLLLLAALLDLAGCGRVAELKPPPGKALPVRSLMARATPTAQDLLVIPPYAKPARIDELVKRSQPRPQDPFDLPPASGGGAPSLPVDSNPEPVTNNDSGPSNPGD